MSVEEFMAAGLESSSDEDEANNSGTASTKSQAQSKYTDLYDRFLNECNMLYLC